MREETVCSKSAMSRTLSIHQEHELLMRLEKAGLTKTLAQRVITDKVLAGKIVLFIRRGGLEYPYAPSPSQLTAMKIMGENCFGPEKLAECFDIVLTEPELRKITKIPFSEATLQKHNDTHILFSWEFHITRHMNL